MHLGIDSDSFAQPHLQRLPVILVVDDEDDFLELCELALAKEGMRVVRAHSAGEALWHALRSPPDLALVDLRLPQSDGFALLHALRAEPETCRIPVFAMTALLPRDAENLMEAGFDGCFPKPVNFTRLSQVLRSVLR